MVYQIEILFRRVRRWLSRSEWLIRLLRLPVTEKWRHTPGLVMIQIDGLSRTQFDRALAGGRLPFLRGLIVNEHFEPHTLYSGLPSSTPAVQGELFYGVKTAVPAFGYMERRSGRIMRMYDPVAASSVEETLARSGEPLLKGGSAYADIYTGGADESHFCPSSLGWGGVLRAANPFALAFLIASNAWGFVRTCTLLVVEFCLAIVDCIRGLIEGRDLTKELKFVPTRVGICILLRELVTIGAKIDIARGLPIIHLNFLGYDEQAHRRGPSSRFAHWTLKGIDDAIARLWRAAHSSSRRTYDLWIYSDHGQEEVHAYSKRFGESLEQAIAPIFSSLDAPVNRTPHPGEQSQRGRLLGGKLLQELIPAQSELLSRNVHNDLLVHAMGPLGLIYSPKPLSDPERRRVAGDMVTLAGVPLVLFIDEHHDVRAQTDAGLLILQDKALVFGSTHPFLDDVVEDLIRLCRHPDAGDFVISGWRDGVTPMSFAIENGSHAGAGPEESHAFALLPGDTPLPVRPREYLRPIDLRHAAQHFLGRSTMEIHARDGDRSKIATRQLRIMTYNVHSCVGMDGKLLPERIARVIAQYAPDIVALQELDAGRPRTNHVDQAHLIAHYLEMEFHFHPAIKLEEEHYGDAVLTHLPMRLVKADALPSPPGKPHLEPRGALWVTVDVDGTEVQIINTHLGLIGSERKLQVEALLSDDWLGHPCCQGPTILCGDFNTLPASPLYRQLGAHLRDTQLIAGTSAPRNTFSGRLPATRIDHIFVGDGIDVDNTRVPSTELTRVTSDHLPVIADIHLLDDLHDDVG